MFGVELSAEQRNELALPWRGGFSLVVPHIGLRAPSGPLAGLFGTTALYAEDLVVDETGLRSLAIGIRGLRFGDVLAIDELGGRWQKGEGFVISGKGRLNAGGGVPPIAGELVVRLGTDGAFIGAGLDLELPSKLTPVAGLTLSGLGFTGLFTRSGDVTLAFRGSLAVGGESGLLGAAIEGARFAYERKGGDPTRGGFQVGATLISLRAGPLGLDIHDVQLSTNRDLRRFGGIGLHAALAQRFNIPVVSVPIPIVPGLEAYVDLDAFGDIGAKLAGSLKRGGASGPLAASGEVSAHGALGVRLSAGVQVGSQLAAALAVGLFAEGKASAEGKATLGGKLSLEGFKVRPAAGAPFEAAYALSGSVVASAGLEIKAKALHVFKKTLYQRTFKTWTLGKYETDGKALLGGKADDWQIKPGESGFAGGLPKPPEHADAAVESHQVDDYLLKEGLAIARGAELRRERVDEITTHYLERDRALISRLDETAQRAADARSRLFDVKQRFLSSVRFGKRIEQLKTESQQLAAEVEALRQSYRTVNLILVDVRGAVASVSDLKLDLGETTLFERLERALRKRAAIDDSKVTALDEKGTALADGARQAASGEEDAV